MAVPIKLRALQYRMLLEEDPDSESLEKVEFFLPFNSNVELADIPLVRSQHEPVAADP
jgi:hypothetical protein